MTLVLAPAGSAAALAYFEQNPEERLRLDEVYMSHAKPSVKFGAVKNALHAATTSTGPGRLAVVLDAGLLQKCPLESGAGFTYGPVAFDCVTTQDYGNTGAMKRPVSGVDTHFVYEVQGDSADLAWLRRNIFGDSFKGRAAALAFLDRVKALVPVALAPHARTFWIWPLYAWPNEAPVGLKDKTLLSLAWSIGPVETGTGRRLLGAPARLDSEPASNVQLYDLYRRHIDVQALRRQPHAATTMHGVRRRGQKHGKAASAKALKTHALPRVMSSSK
jgi:hypothetical protein